MRTFQAILYYLIVTNGTGTTYPSGTPEFTSCFSWVRVVQSLVLYICFLDHFCLFFCFFFFLMVIALSVLRAVQ